MVTTSGLASHLRIVHDVTVRVKAGRHLTCAATADCLQQLYKTTITHLRAHDIVNFHGGTNT